MKLPLNKSVFIAVAIAVSAGVWLASGTMKEEEEVIVAKSVVDTTQKTNVKVLVSTQTAVDHANIVSLYGQTEANREVTLRAETAGRIIDLLIEKGATVKKGDVIARIAMNDRTRILKSAEAAVRFRQLEFEASRKLSQKSFRSQTKLAEAESMLNAARAELESARLDINHTEIKAPFDGILEDTSIEIGDFTDKGDEIAKIIDLSPVVVSAEIPEHAILDIQDGQAASAQLHNGHVLNGIVRFVASTSSTSTRTYKVELEAENPNDQIAAGLTAKLRLKVGSRKAYLVSSAILTLSDQGVIGVKTVDANNEVEFHPVKLIEDTADGIWVAGLPNEARIIVRGQEYVKPGQLVTAVEDQKSTGGSEKETPALAKAQGN